MMKVFAIFVAVIMVASAFVVMADNDNSPEAEIEIVRSEGYEQTDYISEMAEDAFLAMLSDSYHVFYGNVTDPWGEQVFGIGFSDLGSLYEDEEGGLYFLSGFVALEGSMDRVELPTMIELTMDETCGYVYTEQCDPFTDHFIADGVYVQYGVNESGEFFVREAYPCSENPDLVRGFDLAQISDPSIGPLYSYDSEEWVYDDSHGGYQKVTGVSLSERIDFDAIEREINRLLESQDSNYLDSEIRTTLRVATDSLQSYLMSLQTETLMGYDVQELVEISKDLDPNQFIRFNPEGIEIDTVVESASSLVRWLTGIVSVLTVIVCSAVSVAFPAASIVLGSVAGAAVEIFCEVVVGAKTFADVDWSKVAVSAAVGAISGSLIKFSSTVNMLADTALGGVTEACFVMMDGGSITEAMQASTFGMALGFGIGSLFKAVGKVAHNAGKTLETKFDHRYDNLSVDGMKLNKSYKFRLPSLNLDLGHYMGKVQSGLNAIKNKVGLSGVSLQDAKVKFLNLGEGKIQLRFDHYTVNMDGKSTFFHFKNNATTTGYGVGFDGKKLTHISYFQSGDIHTHYVDGSSILSKIDNTSGFGVYKNIKFRYLDSDLNRGIKWTNKYDNSVNSVRLFEVTEEGTSGTYTMWFREVPEDYGGIKEMGYKAIKDKRQADVTRDLLNEGGARANWINSTWIPKGALPNSS